MSSSPIYPVVEVLGLPPRPSDHPVACLLPRVRCTSTSAPNKEEWLLAPTSPSPARYSYHLSQGWQATPCPILPTASDQDVVSRFPLKDTYCNLGWTLLAADVNEDGEPDLVMGSPFAPGGGKQKGMVAAFYSAPSWSNQGSACRRDGRGPLVHPHAYGLASFLPHSIINFT